MLHTLSGPLALMMAALFLVTGGVVAAIVFKLITRRLHLLVEEIEAFGASQFTRARHVAWASADGDEVDRLAFAFGGLADQIARQIGELGRVDAQRRELLANVSHDLRTPLTLMQGYLETMLLRRGELSPAEERSCLEVAARHAERLGRLVADLFELTKLDGQAGRLQAEPFSLTELAQDIAQKFSLHASARDVRIDLALDSRTPLVVGDIGLIERALENLVENALRHTPGGGRVTIEVETGSSAAQVRVRDTGCGISRDNLPHVFDRYFQAPRVESTPGACASDGTAAAAARHHAGLGLAITRRIASLHGSDVHVYSQVGVGTVFGLDLPFVESNPVPATTRESSCRSVSSSSCPVS